MASGDEITLSYIRLHYNKRDRRKQLNGYLVKGCECDKCGLNLDKGFDYFDMGCRLAYHLTHWKQIENIEISPSLNTDYMYDSQLLDNLEQTYGVTDPYTTELIFMSFICCVLY